MIELMIVGSGLFVFLLLKCIRMFDDSSSVYVG